MSNEIEDDALIKALPARPAVWVLRIVIGLNCLRFALSFLPWFEGTDKSAGFADRLFNPHHTDGFRIDFLWLLFSTVVIFFLAFAFIDNFKKDRDARINFYLCVAEVAVFLLYILKLFFSGLIDFG
jgi:hypothetical protein